MTLLRPFITDKKNALNCLLEEIGIKQDLSQWEDELLNSPDKLVAWMRNGCSLQAKVTVNFDRGILEAAEAALIDMSSVYEAEQHLNSNLSPSTLKGKSEVGVFLVSFIPPHNPNTPKPQFSEPVTRSKVLEWLDHMGLKPADTRTLFAFCEEFPSYEETLKGGPTIIAFGDEINVDSETCAAVKVHYSSTCKKYTLGFPAVSYMKQGRDGEPQMKESKYYGKFIFLAVRK